MLAADDAAESPPALAGDPGEAGASDEDDEPLPVVEELPEEPLPRLSVR